MPDNAGMQPSSAIRSDSDQAARRGNTRAIDHYENFPVASLLCPPALRGPIASLYHFARTADDLADEGEVSAEQRISDLAQYRNDLLAAYNWAQSAETSMANLASISTRWPEVFVTLARTLRSHKLPLPYLLDLLDAFTQDVRNTSQGSVYETQDELLDYCRRSANPVGRLLLHLYGVHDAESLAMSDAICTALQLINFWQDLSVDIPRGRHYIPQDACVRFGVNRQDIATQRLHPPLRNLIADQLTYAEQLMLRGAALVHRVPGRAGWELRVVVQGGLRILRKTRALQGRNLTQRPKLKAWDVPLMLLAAARM